MESFKLRGYGSGRARLREKFPAQRAELRPGNLSGQPAHGRFEEAAEAQRPRVGGDLRANRLHALADGGDADVQREHAVGFKQDARAFARATGAPAVAFDRSASQLELARRLAVVPQETHLAFDYSVLEIVLMGRYPHLGPFQFEGPEDLASAHAALTATGTDHLAERAFTTLSGGEKQRVIIASALAQLGEGATRDGAPRVLLLDEPTAALDLRYQIEVASLLRRLHERGDITIVMTTHDVHFASRVCSELVLLGAGRVMAHGTPEEVLTTSQIATLYSIEPAQAALFAATERR